MAKDSDVLIIGSGFGASVAGLRFAEAGYRVIILERGGWITRQNFEADGDMFWNPEKEHYGVNDIRKRGRHIIPWVSAGVGGGSHVYAATLKRRDLFHDFPGNITVEEMAKYYERGEKMMQAMKYPDYPPYNNLPAYCLFREAEKELAKERPDIVEDQGDILLAISFAPEDESAGASFINKYGAHQRYSDPDEQKLLGGGIDVKNSLDKNYLFEAQKHNATIYDYREATRIEPMADGGYRVFWRNPRKDKDEHGSYTTKILVCGAGSIGTTELLLKNKLIYKTLPHVSESLGQNYCSNGDYVTFLVPKRGLVISWVGLLATLLGWLLGWPWLLFAGLFSYLLGWLLSGKKAEPDKGTTNSDYIRFRHRDGSTQGAYIEGGRYPTPIKAITAVAFSLSGNFNPTSYTSISKTINWMGRYIPIMELIERSWPIPILMMGRDDAVGRFYLNDEGEVEIEFPFAANKDYTEYLNKLGRLFSTKANSYFLANGFAKLFKLIEVPHNIGGAPMGETRKEGVVDSYGRVFGYENFLILDGSILPKSLGPNPVNTILALAERAMETVLAQHKEKGVIRPS